LLAVRLGKLRVCFVCLGQDAVKKLDRFWKFLNFKVSQRHVIKKICSVCLRLVIFDLIKLKKQGHRALEMI